MAVEFLKRIFYMFDADNVCIPLFFLLNILKAMMVSLVFIDQNPIIHFIRMIVLADLFQNPIIVDLKS